MQTIDFIYKHELETLRQVEYLYTKLSDMYVDNIVIHDMDAYEDLIEVFKYFGNVSINKVTSIPYEYHPRKNLPKIERFRLVCASGGKDSTAVAKYYKDQGYDVYLFHLKGINVAYWDEHKAVEKIAKELDVPYCIEEVRLSGKHCYVEHPMKNMMIANAAIQFCLNHHYPVNIAFGNYSASHLDSMEFEIDGGDSVDMWNIYENIIRHELPNFKIRMPLHDISMTYDILTQWPDLELFNKSISCMSPYRFRKHWKERTEKKYNVSLLDNRCGCCHKCCLEYMVLADRNILPYNDEYYHYCFKRLWETAEKETGLKADNAQQIWGRYFWYNIQDSHM